MIIKEILLGFLLLTILISCNSSEKEFSNDEKEWFSIYEKRQTLIFKSNLGNFDTLVVSDISNDHNDTKWFRKRENKKDIILTPNICKNEAYCNVEVSMNKDDEETQNFPSFNVFGLTYSIVLNKIQPSEESITLGITNKTYNSVYNFFIGINAYNSGNNYLKSFYWDKKEGLIGYAASDGEVFELLKKD